MGIVIAIALFIAVVAAAYQLQQHEAGGLEAPHDQPKRAPRPGARDAHAVTGMLGRAHVPSWG